MLRSARPDAKKVLFLITDGYSNSGDPRPVARRLRQNSVDIFTFGIRDGNFVELCDMASDDKHEHVYILNSFQEFEALARRALHEGNSDNSWAFMPVKEFGTKSLAVDRNALGIFRAKNNIQNNIA